MSACDPTRTSRCIEANGSTEPTTDSPVLIAYTQSLRYLLMMIDVRDWLHKHAFEQFVDLFEENEIDGDVLLELTNDDLKDLGLPLGSRKKLLKAIARVPEIEGQPAVGSPASTAGERRQVTVLFADLAESCIEGFLRALGLDLSSRPELSG